LRNTLAFKAAQLTKQTPKTTYNLETFTQTTKIVASAAQENSKKVVVFITPRALVFNRLQRA
jgi:hypothetical protein